MAQNLLAAYIDGYNGLEVTETKVFPFKEDMGHLKALVIVTFNGVLTVRGLRVMEGADGLFVTYPLDPFYKGEDLRSIVAPDDGLREYIERKVLSAYDEITR